MKYVVARFFVGLAIVCMGRLTLKAESQSPSQSSATNGQELVCWMNASRIAYKAITNVSGRLEFDVSLWDMGEVYPTLSVKLHAEEDCIVSCCELPVHIQNEHCDALVRLFNGRTTQAPAFTYKVDRANGRAWCESTTPIGLCGDPLHCDGCRRAFVNLAIMRVAREIGSCSREIAQIVGVDGAGDPEIERLRKAVADGDGQACADLGDAYNRGLGVALDRGKAVSFYQLGVARTNADAMVGLADAYQRGDVIEHNEDEAMKLYRRAAKMGNIVAMIMVDDVDGEQCASQWTQPCSASNRDNTNAYSPAKSVVEDNAKDVK